MPCVELPPPSAYLQSPTKSVVVAVPLRSTIDVTTPTPSMTSNLTSPTSSSSNEPSPQAADVNSKSLKDAELAPDQDPAQQQENDSVSDDDDVEELKEALLRRSTGSIAIMSRQQEALDYRRHTFTTMSADSRASMRRRSYDFTAHFGNTFPPLTPPRPLLPSLKAHQHFRLYGKTTGPVKIISECHEQGSPMVAFVSPNPTSVWTRGKPVVIQWNKLDIKIETLCIELLEDGLNATTLIAKEAPNTGSYTYPKVPWGMESGSKYFLRIAATEDKERYCTSSFFQISSAP
ncbi:hypothetical protein CCR75_003186 [Bremia lactucae]|uniref:Yeast cell wall synthesis Kre9/Knh1-like N-terminal domain-containing protein n=1 Tax=Bremia lactucae TaxID=4779 RepID=A0A976IEV7_BRELC|nr:hypothetical protein CCR75_003186 [Bremia lactucae]